MATDKKAFSEKDKEFVPDWNTIHGLRRSNIADISRALVRLGAEKAGIEAQMKALRHKGVELLIKADVKTVLVDGARVTAKDQVSISTDKKKLYALAQKKKLGDWVFEIIEAAKTRRVSQTLIVTPPKAEGEEDEDDADDE